MNLVIPNKVAIESARQSPKNTDLKLLGISSLSNINDDLKFAIQQGSISDHNLFCNVFSLDNLFFYQAEKVVNQYRSVLERGIGCLVSIDNDLYIRRQRPVCYYLNDNLTPNFATSPYDLLSSSDNEYVIVSSTIPPSYIELLYEKNAVITSSDSFLPQPVVINENSVLARLQGEIRSLSLKEFSSVEDFQDAVIDTICSYKNQISLGCSKLSMKSKRGVISSNVFQLSPTSNPPAKKGTLIYDENDDLLKYYDGASWRSLSFTKDNLS